MKRTSLVLTAILALACSALQAQSLNARANVPFDFWMGKTLMPAGDYQVNYSNGLLQVRDEPGGESLETSLTIPEHKLNPPKQTVLVFNRYGDSYFLAKLSAPELDGGCILPKTPREKERFSGVRGDKPVLIALHRKYKLAK